ncbi:GalNAc(5)-diNAcBac-PP-undecaprenol beta-1,3-glucosyltransferase [Mycobacterium simulans]|uniref:GalNAc(5)-diNAcBac-PP-undecaprenol beta-1,3-glucosyltransferase n=2 Tax=Mycobacterium simulans TaxID=627089 RepID=A0A7Z7IJW4_9MYCO|nr:GalNAc(5)-diNAcBac-PP-undecaprenol beta-1,3-glucosyltransferase [Mycobacterium simulans]
MNPNNVDEMPAKPPISVCIPMYNNSATIERCLRSILDQDGVEFEIVVVDDDSPDDCATLAAALLRPGDRLIRNQIRLGLNQNHNRCMELARGDYIQFVHGDDWLLPGALRTLAQCFDDPTVGLAFAPRRMVYQNMPFWQRVGPRHIYFLRLREYNKGSSLAAQMVLAGASANFIGEPTCVMFRRQLALDVGCFRDDIYQLVDLDFWYRLLLRSAVRFVPRKLSVRTNAAATESVRNLKTRRGWLDRLRILTWLIVDPAAPTAIRAMARAWWVPTWLGAQLGAMVLGPERKSRMKTLTQAPIREFAHAKQLRDRLSL